MSQLFSDAWMNDLKDQWNGDKDVHGPLEKANFSATIAYGFKGEENPRGIITVVSGKITKAGAYLQGCTGIGKCYARMIEDYKTCIDLVDSITKVLG